MAEATDVVVHLLDLAVHGIRIAGEDQPVFHEPGERRVLKHLEDAGVAALHRVHRVGDRVVAGWTRELRRHLVRLEVPHQLPAARVAFLVGVPGVHERGVGEAVEARRRQPELRATSTVGVVHRPGAVESGQEAGDDVAAGHGLPRARTTEGGGSDPRDLWLLTEPAPGYR